MQSDMNEQFEAEIEWEKLKAIRREAGLRNDPETAATMWYWAELFDPYRDGLDIPEDCQQIGRTYLARSPDSDIWVCYRDLPAETRDRLRALDRQERASPAGIFDELAIPW